MVIGPTFLYCFVSINGCAEATAKSEPEEVSVPQSKIEFADDKRVQRLLPSNVRNILENPDSFKLMSIGGWGFSIDEFDDSVAKNEVLRTEQHVYIVSRSSEISDKSTQHKILSSVYKSISDYSDDAPTATSWHPGYAVSATKGDEATNIIIYYKGMSFIVILNQKNVAGGSLENNSPLFFHKLLQ